MMAGKYLPAWMDGLTPDMVRKAEKELGETPEVKTRCLQELTDLLKGEPGLNPLLEERFLLRYLRAKKYDVQKAFETLRNFYRLKAKFSNVVTDFKPSEKKHVLDLNCMNVLPYRDKDGAMVGYIKSDGLDADSASAEDLLATSLICSEVGVSLEATIICGSVIVLDAKGCSIKLLRKMLSQAFVQLGASAYQDCVASRVVGVHVVNEPHYFTVVMNVLKKFLKKKIRNRIHFHGSNWKSLYKYVPQEILPESLGGEQKLDYDEYRSKILRKDSYFARFNQYGYQIPVASTFKVQEFDK